MSKRVIDMDDAELRQLIREEIGASPPEPANDNPHLDPDAASKLLGYSRGHLLALAREGKVECVRFRKRVWFKRATIEALLEEQRAS